MSAHDITLRTSCLIERARACAAGFERLAILHQRQRDGLLADLPVQAQVEIVDAGRGVGGHRHAKGIADNFAGGPVESAVALTRQAIAPAMNRLTFVLAQARVGGQQLGKNSVILAEPI